MKRRRRRRSSGLLLLALIGGCFGVEYVGRRVVTPPGSVQSLRAYLDWNNGAGEFVHITIDHQPFIIAYGRRFSLLIPSGPPAYVFDASGQLVDWSIDIGDDPQFDKRWSAQVARGTHALPETDVRQIASTQPS